MVAHDTANFRTQLDGMIGESHCGLADPGSEHRRGTKASERIGHDSNARLQPESVWHSRSVRRGSRDRESICDINALHAAAGKFWNAAIGDDLKTMADSARPLGDRLLHAGTAGATILSLPGGPEALGLKFAAKETLKGGVEQLTFHAVDDIAGKAGKLLLQGGVRPSAAEEKVVAEYAKLGHEVILRPPSGVANRPIFSSTVGRPNSRRFRTRKSIAHRRS